MTILDDIDALADGSWEMTRDELIAAVSRLRQQAHEELHVEYRVLNINGTSRTTWGKTPGNVYNVDGYKFYGGKIGIVSSYDDVKLEAHLATDPWTIEDIESVAVQG